MRHAVVVSPDPAGRAGGVERVCGLLDAVLSGLGWKVDIVGADRPSSPWQARIGAGYLLDARRATRAGLRLKPDLLITNGFLGSCQDRSVKRIHIYHGTMVNDTRAEGSEISLPERIRRTVGAGVAEALAARYATVVCVSEQTAVEVRRFYGVRTNAVIPNCVDTAVFAPADQRSARTLLGLAPDARYALAVGRIQHRKGSDLLIEAARKAGYELLVAGAGDLPGAHQLGILDPVQLAQAYAACDCVVFPTRYEGFGLVALEAIACRRPLLMTKVGWLPTLLRAVPDYEALCIEPEVDDIVKRLLTLDRLNLDDLTRRAREFVLENNSLERYRERWEELLRPLHL